MAKKDTVIRIDMDVLKKIYEQKVHPRQSNNEVLRQLILGKKK